MKIYSPFFFLIFILFMFSTNACKHNSLKSKVIIPIDTIVLDHKIQMSKSKYVPEYNTQVNHYFTSIDTQLCLVYAIDSINPTSIFKLKGSLSAFFCINKDSLIINYSYTNDFLLLNNQSTILNTLNVDLGTLYGEKRRIWTFRHNLSIKKENGEYLLFFQTTSPSLDDFQNNNQSRIKLYSEPILSCYNFSKNKINYTKGIGIFPNRFLSNDGMYVYHYNVSLNKRNEFVFSFYELDSIYIYANNTMYSKPIKSKYKHNKIVYPKNYNIFDNTIIEENSSKTVGYFNHYYDSYRDQYYIIVKKEYKYENDDGTFNKSTDAPWSILILNSKFEQVEEIDMPINYSKHEFFIVPEGIVILDEHLTEKQPNKSVLVIFKIQDYD